ncbi:hypothetical protein HUU53_00570 [Candidatus Micrarchaeota archaeon]|nr:hypothetical protein [Candidatus Micrarchaeota archaeon]
MKLLLGLIVISFLFLGCTQSNTQVNAEVSTQVSVQATQQASAQPSEAMNEPTVQASTQVQGSNELVACLDKTRTWKINYDITTITSQGTFNSQMVQYYDNGKIRTDVLTSGIEARSYLIGNDITSCYTYAGSWTCTKTPKPENTVDTEVEVKQNAINYEADGSIQAAGKTANCFKGTTGQSTIRYCISSDCVPIYVKSVGTSNGQTVESETKATAYTTIVTAADFQLPA